MLQLIIIDITLTQPARYKCKYCLLNNNRGKMADTKVQDCID